MSFSDSSCWVRGKYIADKKGGIRKDGGIVDAFLYCSACRHEAYWDTDYGQQEFDFCPYCGEPMTDKARRMRKEKRNG